MKYVGAKNAEWLLLFKTLKMSDKKSHSKKSIHESDNQ